MGNKIRNYSPSGVIPRQLAEKIKLAIYTLLYTPVYRMITLVHHLKTRKTKYRHNVSLCLIFKNEAPYLKEWIEYHRLIGIEHFYLYNNFSDDNYKDVLAPYIEDNLVTLVEFPVKYGQIKAYEDCYAKAKSETNWLGFIDADEYVNLIEANDIKEFLSSYRRFPSVMFNWKMFGTSGHIEENEEELTTERYTSCWPWLCNTGKGFINNDYDFCLFNAHWQLSKAGRLTLWPVNLDKCISRYNHSVYSQHIASKGYINHYWSRSYSNYIYKDFHKGDVASADCEKKKKSSDRFMKHEINNSAKDYSIQRWLVILKNRFAQNHKDAE